MAQGIAQRIRCGKKTRSSLRIAMGCGQRGHTGQPLRLIFLITHLLPKRQTGREPCGGPDMIPTVTIDEPEIPERQRRAEWVRIFAIECERCFEVVCGAGEVATSIGRHPQVTLHPGGPPTLPCQ